MRISDEELQEPHGTWLETNMARELLAWRKLGEKLQSGISAATCPDECECKTCAAFRPLLAKIKELQDG